jgi:hypothetical protein
MRAYAGFLLILSIAAYMVISLLGGQKTFYGKSVKSEGAEISRYENRFRGVRENMPPHGTFGYFSDNPRDSGNRSDIFLTQYALAPLVLREDTNLPVVVGNFHRRYPTAEEIRRKGLSPLFDSGSGIVLYGKAAR